MKVLRLLPLLSLALFSCGKQQEETSGLKTYKDSEYPFSMRYIPKKMVVDHYESDKKYKHWVYLNIDLSDEFPQEVERGVYMGLYDAMIYNDKNFKGFSRNNYEAKYDEGNLNGIPAIVSKDVQGKPRAYILIIPRVYLKVWLEGVDSNRDSPSISQGLSDRMEQLTYEMIKHFKWEQPIDTNSEEFKNWKAYIWGMLSKGVNP